jgi:hypothetical protein
METNIKDAEHKRDYEADPGHHLSRSILAGRKGDDAKNTDENVMLCES